MKLSLLDGLVWAISFLGTIALLGVLLWRARWKQFPVLTSWMAYQTAYNIAMFALYVHGSAKLYVRIYWITLWPDFLLQLGVAVEIARIVLRPTGTWVRDARSLFMTAGFGGAVVAAILSWWISPPHGTYTAWELRADLFTSLVICELFVAMSFTANHLGLGWRNHVMAEGQGLTAWAGIMTITTALQSYFGNKHFDTIDHFRGIAWIGATAWIAIRLWLPEPERLPLSEDLQKYILALHRRVEYDLRRLDAGQ
ncbi:MAG TPA: hypothetical protein VME18_02960 [Acidobacteriaceae bacterium]|nr:hypothetical protein [Acidobacteriaceae bacterium]